MRQTIFYGEDNQTNSTTEAPANKNDGNTNEFQMMVEGIMDDEDGIELIDTIEEDPEILQWDVDDTQESADRFSYFLYDPSSATFDGFSEKRAQEVKGFIKK